MEEFEALYAFRRCLEQNLNWRMILMAISHVRKPGMLTRPTWHEAKAEARESEAEAKEIYRGRGQGQNV